MKNSLPMRQVAIITIMLALQIRLGPVMGGQDSSNVNNNMQLNVDTELDKEEDLNEMKVQSGLIKTFSAPMIQSLCVIRSLVEGEISSKKDAHKMGVSFPQKVAQKIGVSFPQKDAYKMG